MSDSPDQSVKTFLELHFSPLLNARTNPNHETILDALEQIEKGSKRITGSQSDGIQAIERTILSYTLPLIRDLLEKTLSAAERLSGPSADYSELALQDLNLQENNIATRLRKEALRGLTATLLLHGSPIEGASDLRFLTGPVFAAEHPGLLNSLLHLSSYRYTANDEGIMAEMFHDSDPTNLVTIKRHLNEKTATWQKEAQSLLREFIVSNTRAAIYGHPITKELTNTPDRTELDLTTFFIFPEKEVNREALQSAKWEIFGRGARISGCFEEHVYSILRSTLEGWQIIEGSDNNRDWNILDALIEIRKH